MIQNSIRPGWLETVETVVCSCCGLKKPLTSFSPRNILRAKRNKHGKAQCRECVKKKGFLKRVDDPEGYLNFRDYCDSKKDPEKESRRYKKWADNNPEKVAQGVRRNTERRKQLKESCPWYAVEHNLRTRMKRVIRAGLNKEHDKTWEDFGCTPWELIQHIENQFHDGFSWGNYGEAWQIDHFYPVSKANLEDPSQFLAVCNWQNLRPLGTKANREKSAKVYPEALELFERLVSEFRKDAN